MIYAAHLRALSGVHSLQRRRGLHKWIAVCVSDEQVLARADGSTGVQPLEELPVRLVECTQGQHLRNEDEAMSV